MLVLLASLIVSPPPTPTVNPVLAQLSWLQGEWISIRGDDRGEEIWSAPAGDSMMGMFRLQKAGVTRFVELQTIIVEDGRAVLRIRHMDLRLAVLDREPKPPAYRAIEVRRGEARFGHDTDKMAEIVYRMTPHKDGDRLRIRLVKRDKSARPPHLDFEFVRAPAR